jgi:16S rRNA G966 N2-methylase RsmD
MFYYFGSKARIAQHYAPPRHRVIVEPFAGSAGYACRYPTHDVVLIEADPRVVALWRKLMAMSPAQALAIPAPVVGTRSSDLLVMLRAASEHSLTGAYITVTDRMVSRWANLTRRLADMIPKIQHWRLIEGDYHTAPAIEATWFVDPPYVNLKRGYAERNIDYVELASWCRARRGQVIVCEQAGATWLPFEPLRTIRTTNGSQKLEVVWTGPIAQEQAL